MKQIINIAFIFFGYSGIAFAQQAMTFNRAKELGVRSAKLDSSYASGIHTDTALAVFKNNQDEYILAYTKLLKDLGKFLKERQLFWEKPTRGFNRIYFNKDGKIDYFLFSFRPEQLSLEQENKFGELLNEYIKSYQFPLKANRSFAQCSPVTYMPHEK